jgi:hypothetical protein
MKSTQALCRALAAVVLAAAWVPDLLARPEPGGPRITPPRFEGDQVHFNWDAGGDLQVAPTPNGPWTTVNAPKSRSSSASVPALREGNLFFRVLDNGIAGEPHPIVGGDPKRPFVIQSAALRRGTHPRGNVLVEARLEPGQNPPTNFPLLLDGDVIQLNDEGKDGDRTAGDGVFTGALFFDVGELEGANQFVTELTQQFKVFGTFDGRSIVDARPPGLFDIEAFNRGDAIPVHPSPIAPQGGIRPGRMAGVQGNIPILLKEICTTNLVPFTGTLTNVVFDPVVVISNVVVDVIVKPVFSNVFVTNVVFVPVEVPTNILATNILSKLCPELTNIVVTNFVSDPKFPDLPPKPVVRTNIVEIQVPCFETNVVLVPGVIIVQVGKTNVELKEIQVGTVDEPVIEPRPFTNLIERIVLVPFDGLRTNIFCTNIVISPGIDPGAVTNIDDFIQRPVIWPKSLLITDLSVVEDPSRTFDVCSGRGSKLAPWTFGRLMIDMCNEPVTGIRPGDFTRRWLRSWQTDQVINFDTVTNRNPEILAQVINQWETASGGPDKPLDLAIAPFRLLAIVNRVDLRGNPGYGGTTQQDPCNPSCVGGEARLVFGLIPNAFAPGNGSGGGTGTGGGYGGGDPGNTNNCDAAQFTVIFEYCVPKTSCGEIKDWGLAWYNLSRIPFGPAFNAELQKLTDQFATAGADPSRRPNLSALSQLRVNELLREPWDMREWRLFASDSDAGQLRQVTAKQTPDFEQNFRPIIAEYAAMNAAAILSETHVVPLEWQTPGKPRVPFLGGNAPMPTDRFFWDGPPPAASSIPTPVRHKFSLNTCNGCHAGETGTPFTHVFPRRAGEEARLSDFLTGNAMPKLDPADGVTPHFFADLKRREDDLLRLISEPCFFQLFHVPKQFPH